MDERERLREQTARNLAGLEHEQRGELEAAAALYEANVAEGFPGDCRAGVFHQHAGRQSGLGGEPIELALLRCRQEPHARPGRTMSSFMSRTARSRPTSTARHTIE